MIINKTRRVNKYTISLYKANYILIEKCPFDALYKTSIINNSVVLEWCDGYLIPAPYVVKIAKRCFLKWCNVVK